MSTEVFDSDYDHVESPFGDVELPSRYGKAFIGIITAVVLAIVAAIQGGIITNVEVAHIGLATLTAILVYAVPNMSRSAGKYIKGIIAVLGAGLQALIPFLEVGTVTPEGWLMVLLAGLGALSVGITPNAPTARGMHEAYAEAA